MQTSVTTWVTILMIHFPDPEQCNHYHEAMHGDNGECFEITKFITYEPIPTEHIPLPPARPKIFEKKEDI